MLALCLMLLATYYAQHYASIIGWSLHICCLTYLYLAILFYRCYQFSPQCCIHFCGCPYVLLFVERDRMIMIIGLQRHTSEHQHVQHLIMNIHQTHQRLCMCHLVHRKIYLHHQTYRQMECLSYQNTHHRLFQKIHLLTHQQLTYPRSLHLMKLL